MSREIDWHKYFAGQRAAKARKAWEAANTHVLPWIPVGERLPEVSDAEGFKKVLVACDWYDEPVIGYRVNAGWRVVGSNSEAPVTHWMPLPPKPTS